MCDDTCGLVAGQKGRYRGPAIDGVRATTPHMFRAGFLALTGPVNSVRCPVSTGLDKGTSAFAGNSRHQGRSIVELTRS